MRRAVDVVVLSVKLVNVHGPSVPTAHCLQTTTSCQPGNLFEAPVRIRHTTSLQLTRNYIELAAVAASHRLGLERIRRLVPTSFDDDNDMS